MGDKKQFIKMGKKIETDINHLTGKWLIREYIPVVYKSKIQFLKLNISPFRSQYC